MFHFLQKLVARFLYQKTTGDLLFSDVLISSIKLFFLQIFSLLLGFVLNLILVRTVDLNIYGSYVYIFNLLLLLTNLCLFGLDTWLVRIVPIKNSFQEMQQLKGAIQFSRVIVTAFSLIIAMVMPFIINIIGLKDKINTNWFILCFLIFLIGTNTAINQSVLRGLNKNVLSQVGEKVLKPLLIALLFFALFFSNKSISLENLIWITVAASFVALLATFFFLQKHISSKPNVKPDYHFPKWIKSSAGFFLISMLYVLNSRIDIFILGLFRNNNEVGVYNIALKVSETAGFGLLVINFVIAPVIAKLFEGGDIVKLQSLITRSSTLVFLLSCPIVIGIAIFSEPIMDFFNVNILAGKEALVILCIGQLINIFVGSVGTLLTMSGSQKYSIYSLALGSVASILINLILVPVHGITGTAIATSCGLAIWNLMMYYFVRKKIGITTTAFRII